MEKKRLSAALFWIVVGKVYAARGKRALDLVKLVTFKPDVNFSRVPGGVTPSRESQGAQTQLPGIRALLEDEWDAIEYSFEEILL